MEGCAEALIPNPQKPRAALITEDAAVPFFKSLRVFTLDHLSSLQKYYRRQVVNRQYM